MKRYAACVILLSMGATATAQTASRYEQLVAKAENGDADTDYTALRHAYAESTGYDPYGVKWRAPFTAAWAVFQAKDCATALARSEEAQKIDYTAVSVHAFRADCFRQAGDGARADRELATARGLARSEMAGGDGKTVATAYDIVRRLPNADRSRIREELSGNLCRCTGYVGIVNAIELALRRVHEQGP